MKKLLTLFMFLGTTLLPAQDGITFKIERLSKPKESLPAQSITSIYEKLIRMDNGADYGHAEKDINYHYAIIAQSKVDTPLVNFGYNSFFSGMYRAYAEHRPFVLSPDMMWLLISQGFARHVSANAEQLRERFVNFSGQVSLVVEAKGDMLDNSGAAWEEIFPGFTKQIAQYTGNRLVETLSANFSTTTPVEAVASQITIMEAMKPYFEFVVMRAMCGIPEITLKGTSEDWQRVLDKTKALADYDLSWWTRELEPLLEEFVKASKGDVNKVFWRNMFKYHSQKQYGAPNIIDGWIVKFFPYNKKGKRNDLRQLVGGDDLPDEIVKVDLKYIDLIKKTTTPLELWAGFVGLEQNGENYALTPKIGWMIRKKDVRHEALKQKIAMDMKDVDEGMGGWVRLRVTTVPPALFSVGEIDNLELFFTDKISIPDELTQVKIKRLILKGFRIDEGEEARIKKLFPHTEVVVSLYRNATD
ncbi:hypothetical protein M2103_002401 [Ereboglobus sp. PH5-5]|uniref:DUF4419 domain-containing protein n=1 Tax=Ereboglobus sp. PH5-5 TaxID=2940529 RepID=UPI002404CE37|nr:DUF4419 domain-containing protein [Ereboglobus sp. PH5-5]MDF9834159.1 hypothetical protein [Ereboglobus sp. PH5-5]